MKEIFQHSLIVSGVLLLFSLYIIIFTPFPILEYYSQNQKNESISLETSVEDELIVKKDAVYYKSRFQSHHLTAVYPKGRSELSPIVYYQPLGSSKTDWLKTEGVALARQGYLAVELREETSNNYSLVKMIDRLTGAQEVIQKLAAENHSTLTSFNWFSEGIGGRIILDYLLATNQKSDSFYLVNPYFSFEDMMKNPDTTIEHLAAFKYKQAYTAAASHERNNPLIKNLKKLLIYTTEDFKEQDELSVHLEKLIFEECQVKISTLERIPLKSDEILKNR